MTFLALDSLPPEHKLRNTALCMIKAQYQWVKTKQVADWHTVTRSFKIAQETFNTLGSNWIGAYRWRADDGTSNDD